jgi:hypothetical protein
VTRCLSEIDIVTAYAGPHDRLAAIGWADWMAELEMIMEQTTLGELRHVREYVAGFEHAAEARLEQCQQEELKLNLAGRAHAFAIVGRLVDRRIAELEGQ